MELVTKVDTIPDIVNNESITEAVYKKRSGMDAMEQLEMTVVSDNPIEWWINQPGSHPAYENAKKSLKLAFEKTRELKCQDMLSDTERKESDKFITMLAAIKGPVRSKDRLEYYLYAFKNMLGKFLGATAKSIGHFFENYVPWSHLLKDLFFNNPFTIYYFSFLGLFILSAIVAGVHSAWPIFLTALIPLVATLIFVIGLHIRDENYQPRLADKVKFLCVFPMTVIMWASVIFSALFGQLPIKQGSAELMVVNRNGTVERFIVPDDKYPRYPNLWETVVRGQTTVPATYGWSGNIEYKTPNLIGGNGTIAVNITPKEGITELIGKNYSNLIAERTDLYNQAQALTNSWAFQYRKDQENPSLVALINELKSPNYSISVISSVLSYKEEVTVQAAASTKVETKTIAIE